MHFLCLLQVSGQSFLIINLIVYSMNQYLGNRILKEMLKGKEFLIIHVFMLLDSQPDQLSH